MTVTIDTISLFELLKPKLGAEESKAIVEALDRIPAAAQQAVDEKLDLVKKDFSTKEDISRLELQIARLEIKMNEKFNSLLIWPIATIFAATGITLTVIKFF